MEKNKIQLATTETISSNYSGADSGMFISAALLAPTTIANGAVEVVQNVPFKWNVPNVNLSGIVQDANCDFTDNGTITIADRVLTTERFDVNLKLCKDTYRPVWQSLYKAGRFTGSFEAYLIALTAANVAASRENVIWKGVDGTSGEFDGFETLLAADADLPSDNEIAGTTLSATNIVAELEKVIDAAGKVIYNMPGFAIRLSTAAVKYYKQAQSALGAFDAYHERAAQLTFQGVPLIECAGLSDDVMVATGSGVLWYGIEDLDMGAAEVKLLDQSMIDGSRNVHVVMNWGDGIQYGNVSDIITYGISNSAN